MRNTSYIKIYLYYSQMCSISVINKNFISLFQNTLNRYNFIQLSRLNWP